MKLTVVTLVTRPQNLPAVAQSIAAAALDGYGRALEAPAVHWLVLYDARAVRDMLVVLPPEAPDSTEGYCIEPADGWSGEPFLRNYALEQVTDGHIAWLDDDNTMEPDFLSAVARELAEFPDAALVFDQVLADGTHRLTANPGNMRFSSVDTAQVVAPRDLYGTYRFDNLSNGTDGYMYERLWQASTPGRFRFINEPRVRYNALA